MTRWIIYATAAAPGGGMPPGDWYDAVNDGGCDNTGSGDCVSDIGAAITAYKAADKAGLYFPAGEYLLSSALTVPSGTVFAGPYLTGPDVSEPWLKGSVRFGSSSSFSDLFIGYGYEYVSTAGTHDLTFTRCKFQSTTSGQASLMIFNDGATAIHDLLFTDCLFDSSSNWNGISMVAYAYPGVTTGTIYNVTFDGCHVLEQPRMGFECLGYHTAAPEQPAFRAVNILNGLFEIQDSQAISYACGTNVLDGYSTIADTIIKGSGNGTLYGWKQGLELNAPSYMTIDNVTIYRTYGTTLNIGSSGANSHNTFTDCTFDQSVNYLTCDPSFAHDGSGDPTDPMMYGDINGYTFDNCLFDCGNLVRNRILFMDDAGDHQDNDFSTSTLQGGLYKTGTSAVRVRDTDYPDCDNIYPSGTDVEGWGEVP